MPVPKANQRAVNKYVKNNYDRINVTMPKGQKEVIQAAAAAAGESANSYINTAIMQRMKRDAEGPQEAAEQSIPAQAPEASQDGALVLIPLGQVSVGRGDMRMMYTASGTERQYYVEPVIPDDEWDDLQKAREVSIDDPDGLPF